MPRFNHIELTLPIGTLDRKGKDEIVSFYGEMLGWSETKPLPGMTKQQTEWATMLSQDGYLSFRCSPDMPDQSFILSESENPLTYGEGGIVPHAGLLWNTREELLDFYERLVIRAKTDPKVEFYRPHEEIRERLYSDLPSVGFYFKYIAPLWWDTQYTDRDRMPVIK